MSAYQTPLVVKEIYLPISNLQIISPLTLEQYKEKYGIDLYDVFKIDYNSRKVTLKGFTKLYIVLLESDYVETPNINTPILFSFNGGNEGADLHYNLMIPIFNENGALSSAWGISLTIDSYNNIKTIGMSEI